MRLYELGVGKLDIVRSSVSISTQVFEYVRKPGTNLQLVTTQLVISFLPMSTTPVTLTPVIHPKLRISSHIFEQKLETIAQMGLSGACGKRIH